jgi:hypothetical protein
MWFCTSAKMWGAMKVSEQLGNLEGLAAVGSIRLSTLVDRLGNNGHLMLIILLSLPFLQPLPMMGLSTVFGGAIFFVAASLAMGRRPWIPQRFANRELPSETVVRILHAAKKLFEYLERFVRPRGDLFHKHRYMKRLAGIVITVLAFLLALPLPIPGTNLAAALPIALLALGVLEEDGVFVTLGYLSAFLSVAFFLGLLVLPFFGIKFLQQN